MVAVLGSGSVLGRIFDRDPAGFVHAGMWLMQVEISPIAELARM